MLQFSITVTPLSDSLAVSFKYEKYLQAKCLMSKRMIYDGDSYQHRCQEESCEQDQRSGSTLHLDSMSQWLANRNC